MHHFVIHTSELCHTSDALPRMIFFGVSRNCYTLLNVVIQEKQMIIVLQGTTPLFYRTGYSLLSTRVKGKIPLSHFYFLMTTNERRLKCEMNILKVINLSIYFFGGDRPWERSAHPNVGILGGDRKCRKLLAH